MLKFEVEDFFESFVESDCDICVDSKLLCQLRLSVTIAQKKFDEWLSKQKKAYSEVPNNTLWSVHADGRVPPTYKCKSYLIPIEEHDTKEST